MEFDQREFRRALGHFPTGVIVVTAQADGREPVAMTVSSFNSVSLDPPLVLFSVGKNAPSLAALQAASSFGISVLRIDQKHVSSQFAGGRPDKWAGIEPTHGESGCPLIEPCLATFECGPYAVHEAGDHLIFVCRVLRFRIATEGEPLVFFRGGYHAIVQHAA
jgi:flavin reductase (DIM6/NTAB) family NADH-FMN oxidoreductase RutF